MTTDVAESSTENSSYVYVVSSDRPQGTTSELVASQTSSAAQKILLGLLLFMCFLAFIANLAVLISLLAYKQAAKKTVSVFVCNQTLLDLVVSFFSAVKVALRITEYLDTPNTGVLSTCAKLEIKTMALDTVYTLLRNHFLSNREVMQNAHTAVMVLSLIRFLDIRRL